MASVKIEEVVDHLDSEFRRALADTMDQFAPNAQYDKNAMFRFFLRRVYHHCSIWESVPDHVVKG